MGWPCGDGLRRLAAHPRRRASPMLHPRPARLIHCGGGAGTTPCSRGLARADIRRRGSTPARNEPNGGGPHRASAERTQSGRGAPRRRGTNPTFSRRLQTPSARRAPAGTPKRGRLELCGCWRGTNPITWRGTNPTRGARCAPARNEPNVARVRRTTRATRRRGTNPMSALPQNGIRLFASDTYKRRESRTRPAVLKCRARAMQDGWHWRFKRLGSASDTDHN